MSRFWRMVLFFGGAGCTAVMCALAFVHMPAFGGNFHPYRDHAVVSAVKHQTANVVSSVNFDQRGLDTLGEETILLGSVIGAAALLRPSREEREQEVEQSGRVLDATRLGGYLMLAVTLIIGIDVVVHGHVTPGGGFQGGLILATGLHLMYLAGSYAGLERVRPVTLYELTEAFGALMFAGIGIAGIGLAGNFLTNFLPQGSFGQLLSAGTVPLLNIATGIEVAGGVVVLLARFLEQAIVIKPTREEAAAT